MLIGQFVVAPSSASPLFGAVASAAWGALEAASELLASLEAALELLASLVPPPALPLLPLPLPPPLPVPPELLAVPPPSVSILSPLPASATVLVVVPVSPNSVPAAHAAMVAGATRSAKTAIGACRRDGRFASTIKVGIASVRLRTRRAVGVRTSYRTGRPRFGIVSAQDSWELTPEEWRRPGMGRTGERALCAHIFSDRAVAPIHGWFPPLFQDERARTY
jgi:hypothetical protein